MALSGGGGSSSLRARKKEATQQRLQEAALQLFSEKGFAAVSVDEIAHAADVSRSTFFRYFGSKEAVLFQDIDENGRVFLESLRKRPASETPWQAFHTSMLELAVQTETAQARVQNRILEDLLQNDPALTGRRAAERDRWTSLIAKVFAERAGRSEPNFEDRLAASTSIAVSEQVGRVWRESDGIEVAEAMQRAFEILRSF
jgi:AcrR family transcriptional regulator